jgi:TRAP-type mannitol/chloroaromatic compound transport system permease small subunit
MRKFLKAMDTINEWVGRVSSFWVIILAVVVGAEVILRYVFNRPSLCGEKGREKGQIFEFDNLEKICL